MCHLPTILTFGIRRLSKSVLRSFKMIKPKYACLCFYSFHYKIFFLSFSLILNTVRFPWPCCKKQREVSN